MMMMINHCFMTGCRSLEVASLIGFTQVTTIGNSFLEGCDSMTDLTLWGMDRHLRTIGTDFLFGCANLVSIQFSSPKDDDDGGPIPEDPEAEGVGEPLPPPDHYNRGLFPALTSIGDRFMSGCVAIEEMYMNDLNELREIGGHFMGGCTALEVFEMSGARSENITSVGNFAFWACRIYFKMMKMIIMRTRRGVCISGSYGVG